MENLLATFAEVMSKIGYVAIAVLILLVMITVHEFGHYITGKIFKFGIKEFSIGFGPKILKKQLKRGEQFCLRLIPLGGFCEFVGEDEEGNSTPDAFNNQKPWKRIIVLISGALMNFLLALVLIGSMFAIFGQTCFVPTKINDSSIVEKEYSLHDYDVIIKAQGKNIYLTTDLMNALNGRTVLDEVNFTVIREGKYQDVTVKLRANTNFSNVEDLKTLYNALGIDYKTDTDGNITETSLAVTRIRLVFFATLGRVFEYAFKLAGTIFIVLGQLITGALGIGSIGGTITTISVTADAIASGGLWYLLYISSFIGVNLAVFNLLPIPALDGSRIVFTVIEWIRKKPVNKKVEGWIHAVGFILLIGFAIFIDLQRLF